MLLNPLDWINKGHNSIILAYEPRNEKIFFAYANISAFVSSLIRNFKSLAVSCDCKTRFVSGLIINPQDRFCHGAAQICYVTLLSELVFYNILGKSFIAAVAFARFSA